MKARVAREISDAASLYLTEILVENILEKLTSAEMATLLGSFVC